MNLRDPLDLAALTLLFVMFLAGAWVPGIIFGAVIVANAVVPQ